jgi:hypothetical protein
VYIALGAETEMDLIDDQMGQNHKHGPSNLKVISSTQEKKKTTDCTAVILTTCGIVKAQTRCEIVWHRLC